MDASPISAARWLLDPPVGIRGPLRRFLTALVLAAAAANAGGPPPADVAPPHGPRPDRSPVEIGRPDLGAKGTASVGARTPVEGGSPLDRPRDGHHEDRPGSRGRRDGGCRCPGLPPDPGWTPHLVAAPDHGWTRQGALNGGFDPEPTPTHAEGTEHARRRPEDYLPAGSLAHRWTIPSSSSIAR